MVLKIRTDFIQGTQRMIHLRELLECDEDDESFFKRYGDKLLNLLHGDYLTRQWPMNVVVRWIEPGGPQTGEAEGLGDMSAAVKTAKKIQEHFPNARVFMTNKFYDAEEESPPVTLHTMSHELLCGIFAPCQLAAHLAANANANPTLMLDVATPDTTTWPFEQKDLTGCYHIDEYNGERTASIPQEEGMVRAANHDWFSSGIGLDQTGNPAVGIHIDLSLAYQKISRDALIAGLENQTLVSILQNRNVRRSEGPPELYFAYTAKGRSWFRFFHAVLAYEASQPIDRDVEFVLVSHEATMCLERFLRFIDSHWFTSSAFRTAEIIDLSSENVITRPLGRQGYRKIRLIFSSRRVSHHDARLLMQATGIALLVTGDQSWAEAVSLKNRVIFYETRPWKKNLSLNLLNLAEAYFGSASKIHAFLAGMLSKVGEADYLKTWISKSLSWQLADEEFLLQHEKLMDILHRTFNEEKWLFGLIQRSLFLQKFPDMVILENSFKSLLVKKDFGEAHKKFVQISKLVGLCLSGQPTLSGKKRKAEGEDREPKSIRVTTTPYRAQLAEKMRSIFSDYFDASCGFLPTGTTDAC